MSLTGKVVIVTGSNTGIGRVSAKEFASQGAHVIMACRSREKSVPVVEQIQKETANEKVEFAELDLLSLASVKAFATAFKARNLPLHILLNNAGIMACPFTLSKDGIESQFATNHLAHFYLTLLLLPVLAKTSGSHPVRIVNVSSMAHKWHYKPDPILFDRLNDEKGYNAWSAYGQSKLANILFTRQLASYLKDQGLDTRILVNCVHPGVIATDLGRHVSVMQYFSWITSLFMLTPQRGAETQIYVCTSPDIEQKQISGEYFVPFGKIEATSKVAQDMQLAKKLWDFSLKQVEAKTGDVLFPLNLK